MKQSGVVAYFLFTCFNLINKFMIANSMILVFDQNNLTLNSFDDMTAAFGPHLPDDGFEGYIAVANPIVACSKIEPPPNVSYVNPKRWIALVQRSPGMFSNCTFDVKVFNAQQAGFSAVIIFNSDSDNLIKMSSSGQFNVKIPSVFVGYSTGMELKESYTYVNKTFVNISTDDNDLNYLLIPFICVVSICFLLAMSIFLIKFVMHCHKIRKNRFPRSALKKIPTKKYQKSDKYDTCPICLNEYEEGVKIRLLPCEHVYHIECIDKWLLRNNRVCPVCKRRVIPGEPDSDEESSSNRPTSTSNVEIEQMANEDEETTESSRLLISRNDDNSMLNGSIHTLLNANSNELGSLNNQMTTSISSGQQLQTQSQSQLGQTTTRHGKYGSISSINNIALTSSTTATCVEPSSSFTNQHAKKRNTHKTDDDLNNDQHDHVMSDEEQLNDARKKKKRPSLDYFNEGIDSKATPDYFTPQSITSDSSAGFTNNDTTELTHVDERNLLLGTMSKKSKTKEQKQANNKKQRKLVRKNNKIDSETSNNKQEQTENDLIKSKSKESKQSKARKNESNINTHATDDRACLIISPSKSSSKKHQEEKTNNVNDEESESSATLSDSNENIV